MKTINNIIEYINESKIVDLFKNLFSKLKTFFQGEDNFENNYGKTYQTQIKSFYTQKNEKITNGFLSSSDRLHKTKT